MKALSIEMQCFVLFIIIIIIVILYFHYSKHKISNIYEVIAFSVL